MNTLPSGHEPGDWRASLTWTTRGGRPVLDASAHNVITILRGDPRWRGVLAHDEFRAEIVFAREPPWRGSAVDPSSEARVGAPWTDTDYGRLAWWCGEVWSLKVATHLLAEAVPVAAGAAKHHPVRAYLDALTWDGVARVDQWLATYAGADDAPAVRATGTRWLLSAVARVFEPGCKVDTVLILEGRQGLYKSSLLRVLAGEWFADTPIELGTKDGYLALRGAWILELAELDSLIRAEASKAKAFFSSTTDRYRPPYARAVQEFPRQCVFAGTVNHGTYLRDATGARRYLPVACTRIDLDALRRDRDALWAEAVARYRAGERWWLDATEAELLAPEQEARYQADAWEPLITAWLARPAHTDLRADGTRYTSMGAVLKRALEIEPGRWSRGDEMRVAACLQRLGWRRVRLNKAEDPGRPWVYVPLDDAGRPDVGPTAEVGAAIGPADDAAVPRYQPDTTNIITGNSTYKESEGGRARDDGTGSAEGPEEVFEL